MVKLGDVCEKITDYVASGSFASLKENVLITNDENYALLVKTADFANNFTKNLTYTDKHGYDFLRNSNLYGGELLLSNIGSIGKVFIVPKLNRPMTLASNSIMLKTSSIELRDYLYYYFQSDAGYKQLLSISSGTSVKKFNKTDLKAIEIPLYDAQSQLFIVNSLKKVDELIALRKQQLTKLDELVKSRFIELFGDPENSTTKWERTTFSSVCLDMHQGINTVADKVEYVNSGFPIIQSKNITSGYLDLEDVRYVTESDYEYYRNKYNPKPSDLLVCNIGTIGKSLIVKNEVDFLIAWNLFLIKLNKELVNPIFIKVFIELLNQQNYFEKFMTGGTVKFVNKKTMGNISTPIPPMALQEQFATFVEQTDKSKSEIQTALTKLETLKKALMQQYFG